MPKVVIRDPARGIDQWVLYCQNVLRFMAHVYGNCHIGP